uniref:Uncharacterized protein n=1 Tax=Oryza barthii TaxID=65489 RepID=A0A0D3HVM2_9ORYZ
MPRGAGAVGRRAWRWRVLLARRQADAVVARDSGGGGGCAKARDASEVKNKVGQSRSDDLDVISCGDMGGGVGDDNDKDAKHRNPRKRQSAFDLTRCCALLCCLRARKK